MVGKHVFVPFALGGRVTGAPGLALAGVLALALGYPASAQDLPALESHVGPERIEDGESSVAVVFEGFVNGPDGVPAGGAVVVSSAGGRAVTDASGSFRLDVRVPVEAESVQITAVGGGGTTSSRAAGRASRVPVRAGRCARARPGGHLLAGWLPTFGSPGEPAVPTTVSWP